MAEEVQCEPGGIRSLLDLLNGDHGEAVRADLLNAGPGWSRFDFGRRLGWGDLLIIVKWLPPTGQSAYFRSRKPTSWWKQPEHELQAGMLFALQGANWQRGGCKGQEPKPIKFPEDRDVNVRDASELAEKRRIQSEHLKRRREESKRR